MFIKASLSKIIKNPFMIYLSTFTVHALVLKDPSGIYFDEE